MSISVKGVSKKYGEQLALDHVSFEIPAGQIVGFLGPNGAGKSTMMKIITTYLPQTEGTVHVCELNTAEHALDIRARVGYLPEHNPLYTELYVREYLAYAAGIHRVDPARIEEMIVRTGLSPESHKKIGQLSKGYRQRVGLAQALLHDPEVLILDEPTTGLDPNQILEIRELIREIGKSKTVLLSTHIMQEVEMLCDRVIIINKGKIITDQPTAALVKGQSTRIQLELDGPMGKNQFTSVPGVLKALEDGGNKWTLETDGRDGIQGELFNLAVRNQRKILGLAVQQNKLEEVFRSLTR